jgi:hypothetical protein
MNMGKDTLMRNLCLWLSLSLTGCAGSLNPLYEKADDLLDPKDYLGVWSDNDKYTVRTTKSETPGQDRLVLLELLEDPRVGRIPPNRPVPPGNGAMLVAGLVKVGEHVFLDVTFAPEMLNVLAPDFAPTARMHLVQTHSFSKVRLKDDALILEALDLKKLVALLAKNPKLVAHKRIHQRQISRREISELDLMTPAWKEGAASPLTESSMATGSPSLLFTAEPAELRAFLGKHATADIWAKPRTFTRGDDADFDNRWRKLLERLQDAEKRRARDEVPPRELPMR